MTALAVIGLLCLGAFIGMVGTAVMVAASQGDDVAAEFDRQDGES